MFLIKGTVLFLIILFIGMYLTELYQQKDKKKAWKKIEDHIRTAIFIIGPILLIWAIISLFI